MAVHKQYNHIMNKHSGHDSTLFPKCLHGRLHGRERQKNWLKPGNLTYLNYKCQ